MFLILGIVLLLVSGMQGFEIQSTRFQYENLHRHLGKNRVGGPYTENWIEQKLDNFDPTNTETFEQQYFTDDQFLDPEVGGDIYIEIGGEWDVTDASLGYSLIYQLCEENGGFYLAPEHRFYGQSFPEPYEKEQIKYLSVQQAIPDLDNLIAHLKLTIAGLENARIIVSGCSYAGALATFFKKKHAEERDYIAWSSSGPIFAKENFYEYNDIVSAGVKHFGGQACFDNVRGGFEEINELITSGDTAQLKELMLNSSLADYDFSKKLWHDSFYYQLVGAFTQSIQYNGQQPPDIKDICKKIADADSLVTGIYYVYADFNQIPRSRAAGNPDDSWTYQTCTSFGWFQTFRTSDDSIMPIDLSTAVSENNCLAKFKISAKQVKANIDKTNAQYGGYHPGIVSNLLSTLGEYDPWRPVCLQSSPDVVTPILITKDGSHCADYNSDAYTYTKEEQKTKTQIKKIINGWLNE